MARRKIIVITPIRNEEWILDTFLKAASVFADHIVLGDHQSTDASPEIAAKYPKVLYFKSRIESFSERERRNELLNEARKFGPGHVLISLDADELLSPDFVSDENLEKIRNLEPGTRIALPFFNLKPRGKEFWVVPQDPIGFVDDGAVHDHDLKIHFPRIPLLGRAPVYRKTGAGILHLQYLDWSRMESKHRWYRVLERITFPKKTSLEIARRYSHMYAVPRSKLVSVPEGWRSYYSNLGIDFERLSEKRESYWWDFETLELVSQYGTDSFKYIDLRPLVPDYMPRFGENAFWSYVRLTTSWTGLSRYSPSRIFLLLLDLLIRGFWK
jgi:glycosyltransferase involved in cell wall biosynthesis